MYTISTQNVSQAVDTNAEIVEDGYISIPNKPEMDQIVVKKYPNN